MYRHACFKQASDDNVDSNKTVPKKSIMQQTFPLMSRIERKYGLISTSYLTGLFDIFILLHI